jgi:ABC-type uncharacterized transport system involved in gliding motility auxiliary subunit
MKKTLSSLICFSLLIFVFLSAMLVNNRLLNTVSLDLTENKIYSLSKGSQNIASNLNERITLYLFFSENNSSGMTALRDYKVRVESLLQEYVKLAKGNITLEVIDPEPFSDAEDRAGAFGLTKASTTEGQNALYFGLAGTNSLDDTIVIGFFDPSKEAFLEYDISSLLYKLDDPDTVALTIVTDLEIVGGQNPLSGETTPAYVLYQQLQEIFEVTVISSSDSALPQNTRVLMLWHPQNINDRLLFDIDQFLMQGGNALALVDAHYESDPMSLMGSVGANSSSLPLLASYGIDFDSSQVVLDALTGLEVRNSEGGTTRHLGFLGLTSEQINKNDITSADLDSINGASFGSLALASNSQLRQTALLRSSASSDNMPTQRYMATRNPEMLSFSFSMGTKPFTLAARYSGSANSHFSLQQDSALARASDFVSRTDNLKLVVIADADIAADRFWVQQSDFFGQAVFNQFANNSDFILNTLENLGGSENLIGVRGRGTFARPFNKVQEIQLEAEKKFREQEKLLKEQLEETEQKLSQLQTQEDSLALSGEQELAMKMFTEQRTAIRKSLRDVQFQLQKDIDELGTRLKVLNIVIMPVVLVLLLLLCTRWLKQRAPADLMAYVLAKSPSPEPVTMPVQENPPVIDSSISQSDDPADTSANESTIWPINLLATKLENISQSNALQTSQKDSMDEEKKSESKEIKK